MGYKIYAGSIGHYVDNNNDVWDDQMIWVEHALIHDSMGDAISDEQRPCIEDGTVSLENLAIPQFSFTVPKKLVCLLGGSVENPYYEYFKLNETFVSVIEDDEEEVFFGCVTSIEKQGDLSKVVTCLGLEHLLENSCTRIAAGVNYLTFKTEGEIPLPGEDHDSIFDKVVLNGSYYKGGNEKSGLFTVPLYCSKVDYLLGKTKDTSEDGDTWGTEWDLLNSFLFDEYAGYFRLYREPVTPGDWEGPMQIKCFYSGNAMSETKQKIEYGKNLIDLTYTEEMPSDFVNKVALDAVVTTTKGWWIFKKTKTELVFGCAEDKESEKKYGIVERRTATDEATTEEKLNELAKKQLDEYKQDVEPVLDILAFDRRDIGEDTDRLGLLKKTYIHSDPHGVNGWYICTKETIKIDRPDEKQLTYGLPSKKLTAQQASEKTTVKHVKERVRGIVSNLNG